MVIWGKLSTTCKPHSAGFALSTKKTSSRFDTKTLLHLDYGSHHLFASLFFQVCDQPHPLHVKNMVRNVLESKFDDACHGMKQLYDLGYSPTDIITTLFRIIKNYDMAEYLKLEFMKVYSLISSSHHQTHLNSNLLFYRKLDLRIWESVMELDHIYNFVVFSLS